MQQEGTSCLVPSSGQSIQAFIMLTMILAANVLQDLFNQLLLEALVGILGS
jgi:hypothetical protein